MAGKRKTGGRDFVKGQSGNPNGRPKKSDEQKQAEKALKEVGDALKSGRLRAASQFFNDIIECYNMPYSELQKALTSNAKTTAGQRVMIKYFLKCMKDGNTSQMSLLMKMMGADEIKIDLTSSDNSMSPKESESISAEQLLKVAKAYVDTSDK